jgi:uncharacterized membrane protein
MKIDPATPSHNPGGKAGGPFVWICVGGILVLVITIILWVVLWSQAGNEGGQQAEPTKAAGAAWVEVLEERTA